MPSPSAAIGARAVQLAKANVAASAPTSSERRGKLPMPFALHGRMSSPLRGCIAPVPARHPEGKTLQRRDDGGNGLQAPASACRAERRVAALHPPSARLPVPRRTTGRCIPASSCLPAMPAIPVAPATGLPLPAKRAGPTTPQSRSRLLVMASFRPGAFCANRTGICAGGSQARSCWPLVMCRRLATSSKSCQCRRWNAPFGRKIGAFRAERALCVLDHTHGKQSPVAVFLCCRFTSRVARREQRGAILKSTHHYA